MDCACFNGDIVYKGLAADLTQANVHAVDDTLKLGERRYFVASFHMPKGVGYEGQGRSLEFDLAADAVQTKNNPYKLFD